MSKPKKTYLPVYKNHGSAERILDGKIWKSRFIKGYGSTLQATREIMGYHRGTPVCLLEGTWNGETWIYDKIVGTWPTTSRTGTLAQYLKGLVRT